MAGLVKTIADFNTTLALKVAVGDTTATLTSATDDDGVALPTGTYGFTIDRKSSNKEYIECTLTGTALTNIKTVLRGTGVASSGFAFGQATFSGFQTVSQTWASRIDFNPVTIYQTDQFSIFSALIYFGEK